MLRPRNSVACDRVADGGIEGDVGTSASDWILLAEDRRVLDLEPIREATVPLPERAGARAWSDDYSNILQVLSFGRQDKSH